MSGESSDDGTGTEEGLRRTIVELFGWVPLRGLTTACVRLRDVYVDLVLRSEAAKTADWAPTGPEDDAAPLVPTSGQREEGEPAWEEAFEGSLAEAIRAGLSRSIVVLGDVGSGKTTMLRMLALSLAETPGAPLPIFLPLASAEESLARASDRDLIALAAAYWRRLGVPGSADLFERATRAGRAVWLLDGVDEISDRARRSLILRQIQTSSVASGPGNVWIVTSRKTGFDETPLLGPRTLQLVIVPLQDEAIGHFLKRNSLVATAGPADAHARTRAEAEARALVADLRADPELQELARSPLALGMLVALSRRHGRLPRRRVELYQAYIQALLEQREEQRSDGARAQRRGRFDVHGAIDHLVELGLAMHQMAVFGVERAELERLCRRIVARHEGVEDLDAASAQVRTRVARSAGEFLHDVIEIAGLLSERSPGIVSFSHRSILHFFAGRALARMRPEQRWATVRQGLHDGRWWAPLVFTAGWLGLVERRREEVTQLCEQVLAVESRWESLIYRDLRLVTRIVGDHVGVLPRLLDRLSVRYRALAEDSRLSFARAVGCTGMVRLLEEGFSDARDWVERALLEKDWLSPLPGLSGRMLRPEFASLREALMRHPTPGNLELLAETWHTSPEVRGFVFAEIERTQGRFIADMPARLLVAWAEDPEFPRDARRLDADAFDRLVWRIINTWRPTGSLWQVLGDAVDRAPEHRRRLARRMRWWRSVPEAKDLHERLLADPDPRVSEAARTAIEQPVVAQVQAVSSDDRPALQSDALERDLAVATDPNEEPSLRIAALSRLSDGVERHSEELWERLARVVETDTDGNVADFAQRVLLNLEGFLPPEGGPRRGRVRLDGTPVGVLEETPQGSRFTYDAAWLARADAQPISLTLPLRQAPYESVGLHPFFENLLPEGWLLELLSHRRKIAKNDRFGLLLAACEDTVGAVEIVEEGVA